MSANNFLSVEHSIINYNMQYVPYPFPFFFPGKGS